MQGRKPLEPFLEYGGVLWLWLLLFTIVFGILAEVGISPDLFRSLTQLGAIGLLCIGVVVHAGYAFRLCTHLVNRTTSSDSRTPVDRFLEYAGVFWLGLGLLTFLVVAPQDGGGRTGSPLLQTAMAGLIGIGFAVLLISAFRVPPRVVSVQMERPQTPWPGAEAGNTMSSIITPMRYWVCRRWRLRR